MFGRRAVAFGLLALLLAAAGSAATPERSTVMPRMGRADPRVRVDASAPPWRAVARLQVPGVVRCTAVVVAPRLAVTAAHCLWSRRLGGWVPAGSVHLLAGYSAGGFAAHILASGYRVAPGYDPADSDGTRGADLARVTLAASAEAVMPLADESPAPGTAVAVGGYNQDRAEIIEADTHCLAIGEAHDRAGRPLLVHDCSATRGTSGGPLLVAGQLGGIQVGARDAAAGGVAVPVETLRQMLAR